MNTKQKLEKAEAKVKEQELRNFIVSEFVNTGFITVHQWRNFTDYLEMKIQKEVKSEMEKREQEIKDKIKDECYFFGRPYFISEKEQIEWIKRIEQIFNAQELSGKNTDTMSNRATEDNALLEVGCDKDKTSLEKGTGAETQVVNDSPSSSKFKVCKKLNSGAKNNERI